MRDSVITHGDSYLFCFSMNQCFWTNWLNECFNDWVA